MRAINNDIDGTVICTPPNSTKDAVIECAENGIKNIWIHKGIGAGSFTEEAFSKAKELNLQIIPGACPMMFLQPDIFNRCLRWVQKLPEVN